MSMSLDSFLNFCESIVNTYICWFADLSVKGRDWTKIGFGTNTATFVIEEFLVCCEELLDSEMFKAHSRQAACKLLKELYERVDEYHTNPNTMLNILSKEKLLQDSKWIEIQDLARKTKNDLELFIKEKRLHV